MMKYNLIMTLPRYISTRIEHTVSIDIASEHSYAAKPSKDNRNIGVCSSDAGVWLKFKDISLSAADQKILEDGGMLISTYVNFAQRLLKHAFPNING